MGTFCSKKAAITVLNKTNSFYNDNKKKISNILIIGNSGTGKSTLLYSLKLPEWNSIAKDMVPTSLFHYEKVNFQDTIFSFFDMSGAQPMQYLWPCIYNTVYFKAVIFVVSLMEENHEKSKLWINRLLYEHALQESTIILLINQFSQSGKDVEYYLPSTIAKLDLNAIPEYIKKSRRFMWYVINATNGLYDENWASVLLSLSKN